MMLRVNFLYLTVISILSLINRLTISSDMPLIASCITSLSSRRHGMSKWLTRWYTDQAGRLKADPRVGKVVNVVIHCLLLTRGRSSTSFTPLTTSCSFSVLILLPFVQMIWAQRIHMTRTYFPVLSVPCVLRTRRSRVRRDRTGIRRTERCRERIVKWIQTLGPSLQLLTFPYLVTILSLDEIISFSRILLLFIMEDV